MKKILLGAALYFLLISTLYAIIGVWSAPHALLRPEANEPGVAALSAAAPSASLFELPSALFRQYPNQLIAPGGFDGAQVAVDTADTAAHFGTQRLMLRLAPGQVYALSMTAPDVAATVYINGDTIAQWGVVGQTAGTSQAMAGTLYAVFAPDSSEVELVVQYSGFIRPHSIVSFYVGSPAAVVQMNNRLLMRDFIFAGSMLTAALLYIGMYLFVGRRPQYLAFALSTFSLCVYKLSTGSLPLTVVLPLSGAFVAKLEYCAAIFCMAAVCGYTRALFPRAVHASMLRVFCGGAFALALFILLSEPLRFTTLRPYFLGLMAAMAAYVLYMLLWRARQRLPDQTLALCAIFLLVTVALLEMLVFRWTLPHWYGRGLLSSIAMMGMIFLNMIALALQTQRIEQALSDATRTERELIHANQSLNRLNAQKNELLRSVSSEMQTPLAVISGYAQLNAWKIRSELPANDIPKDMDAISEEAKRLSGLVSTLLETYVEEVAPGEDFCDPILVMQHCAELYEPVARRKNNRLRCSPLRSAIRVPMDAEALTQVLLNILADANHRVQGSRIDLVAERYGNMLQVTVTDNGKDARTAPPPTRDEYRQTKARQAELDASMSICKKMVEAVGGSMGTNGVKNVYTTVWVALPLAGAGSASL